VFSEQELSKARERGAVGDLCLRFFDRNGRPVSTPLDKWVIGMELDQLRKVNRRIGVAGGRGKVEAIRAALKGGWINGLITDRGTAGRLVSDKSG
jgi:DNA-binding transcriptional regulator LsrR (DeoR family)